MSQGVLDFLVTPQMTDGEAEVWHVLRFREGAAQAMRMKDLAERVGLGTRQVQRIVRNLIHSYGKPVGTSMAEPYGYYHAVTPEERQSVADLHKRRAIAVLATAAKIEGISRTEYVRRHQTELGGAA